MSEGEAKEAIGVCAEVVQKPGSDWVEFHIDVGTKYPVRLSTKLDALIKDAKAVGGDVATWHYKESDGNPNPNKPGTFYKNRYLSSVELGGIVLENRPNASGSPTSAAQDGMSKEEWAAKDRASDLRACIAISAGTIHLMDEPSDEDLNEWVRQVLLVARQFHAVVSIERNGGLSEADSDIPF